jgi:dCTP deaminase
MILPDQRIQGLCQAHSMVKPFVKENLQPASLDLTLASDFKKVRAPGWTYQRDDPSYYIDLTDVAGTTTDLYFDHVGPQVMIRPNEFVLGRTQETVTLPDNIVGRVEGKSSLGRLGLLVHSTAGYVDPGFSGTITLEFYNLNKRSIILSEGLRICQISFSEMSGPARKPYGSDGLKSKYQNQQETTVSRYEG